MRVTGEIHLTICTFPSPPSDRALYSSISQSNFPPFLIKPWSSLPRFHDKKARKMGYYNQIEIFLKSNLTRTMLLRLDKISMCRACHIDELVPT